MFLAINIRLKITRTNKDERFTELNYMVDELSNLENTSSEVDMENIILMVTFLIILQTIFLELFDMYIYIITNKSSLVK
jgi:hypothetical protein